jgi:hypothetical protein
MVWCTISSYCLDCYWSFLRADFAGVARCSWEEVAGAMQFLHCNNALGKTLPVMHQFLAKNSPVITQPLWSRSKWLLAVPYSEKGPQGDTFCNYGGHRIECRSWTRKIPKEAFHWCFPQWQNWWSKRVCACTSTCLFSWVRARKGPTLKVIR